MDCTVDQFADLVEWRADVGGVPGVVFSELDDLVDEILAAADAGCPVVDDSYYVMTWAGGCVTPNGYGIEIAGTSLFSGEAEEWDLTLTPTDTADGTWPTGTLRIARESTSSTRDITAYWALTDAGATRLPLTGSLAGGWGTGSSCLPYSTSYAGDLDGCAFASEWANLGRRDGRFVRELHAITVGAHTATVATELCGSVVGELDGASVWLDDAWEEVARTDIDGDLCAVEDCDCDDADPSVRPGAADVSGDGVDSDCNGDDAAFSDDCPGVWDRCGAELEEPADTAAIDTADTAAVDTAGPTDTDTGPPADTSAADSDSGEPADTAVDGHATTDRSSPERCGCSTPASPGAGLLLGLVALLRRRR